jgi:ribosomal protein S18 acetylase RimI-like enzyme
MDITIRRCGGCDIETLRTLSLDTFRAAFGHLNTPENMAAYCAQAFGEDALRRQLETPGSSFWFLYADGELAGYTKLNTDAAQTDRLGENALEIERIYIAAAFQGQGLGGRLIDWAVDTAQEWDKQSVWLGVWEHNTRAISFYEAHGFCRSGTHAFYLGAERQTDIIMRRELPQKV